MRLFLYISVYFIISQVMAQSLEEIQKEYSEGMKCNPCNSTTLFFSLLLTYFNRYFDRERIPS